VFLFVGLFGSTAEGTTFEMETFESDWTMGSEWTPDRRLPNVVQAADFRNDSRLHFGIEGDDKTDTWRDYEGVKHAVSMPEWSVQRFSVDLWIGDDWDTTDRNAGLWAQGEDASGSISAWPILTYRNSDSTPAGFYSYDYLSGGWDLFLTAQADDFQAWHTLEFTLYRGTGVEYLVDGTSLGLFSDNVTADLSHVILNAYNYGVDADIYFDNFQAQAVPEPMTMLAFGSAVAGLGGYIRRRRRA
jgi:hypothetical protein